jgi:MFS family permease
MVAAPETKHAPPERPLIELIKHVPYWRWQLASILLMIPGLTAPIAFELVSIHYTHGPGLGGLLISASIVPRMVGGPIAGRILDRVGPTKWAPRLLLVQALSLVALALGFALRLPTFALVLIALTGGLAASGIGGVMRLLLGNAVPEPLMGSALSIDAVFIEIVIIIAPFIVVVSAFFSAVFSIVAMGLAVTAAALLISSKLLTSTPSAKPENTTAPATGEAERPLWRNFQFLFWVLVAMACTQAMGTADLNVLPVAVAHHGGVTQAALFSSAMAAASVVCGLAYAWFCRRIRLTFAAQAAILLVLITASYVLINLAHSWIGLAFAFAALGLWSAPLNTVVRQAPAEVIPKSRMVESFSILTSATYLTFAATGGLLAVLPSEDVLLLGPSLAIVALACMPLVFSRGKGTRQAPQQVGTRHRNDHSGSATNNECE